MSNLFYRGTTEEKNVITIACSSKKLFIMQFSICYCADSFLITKKCNPWNFRNCKKRPATSSCRLRLLPAADSRLASAWLWPMERSRNDAAWVPRRASRSLAWVFSGTLLLPPEWPEPRALTVEDHRGREVRTAGPTPQQCVGEPGSRAEERLRVARNRHHRWMPVSLGQFGAPNHRCFLPEVPDPQQQYLT